MIDVVLKEDERIDDLERNGYKIIQNSKKFCFGIDAVLLSSFARVNDGENVLDLGTGTGIIPILLKGKTNGEHFTGLEIQDDSADMAHRPTAEQFLAMVNLLADNEVITVYDNDDFRNAKGRH